MKPTKLAIFSSTKVPELPVDERFLLPALGAEGIRADVLLWDAEPLPDLSAYDAVLVRTIWGYYLQPNRYTRFLDHLAASGKRVQNSVPLLRWNAHKRYLLDLAEKQVDIVTTVFQSGKLNQAILDTARRRFDTPDLVVKPAISASAHDTYRLGSGAKLPIRLREDGEWLIQPCMPQVRSEGEWSLMFFGGRFSHAIRKVARVGDFRVQHEYGGRYIPTEPGQALVGQAAKVLDALPETPLFARVDGVVQEDRFLLMELELIEPDLFLQREEVRSRWLEMIIAFVRGDKWQ